MKRTYESKEAAWPALRSEEVESHRKRLLARKRELLESTSALENDVWRKGKEAGELSTVPDHMADLGTDSYEQEVSVALLENGSSELREIDRALERLDEGTYGVCEECTRAISRERLRAIPHARLCLPCKKAEEEWLGT